MDTTDAEGRRYAPYMERVRVLLRRYALIVNLAEDAPPGTDLSAQAAYRGLSGAPMPERHQAVLERLNARLAQTYDTLAEEAGEDGERFEQLRHSFGLNTLECDALWVLLSATLDVELLWLQRTLWGDAGRADADPTFLRHVLDPTSAVPEAVFRALDTSGTLRTFRLVESAPGPHERLRVPTRVQAFLLRADPAHPEVPGVTSISAPPPADSASHIGMLDVLTRDTRRLLREGFAGSRRFLLLASSGSSPRRVARELLHDQGTALIEVDVRALLESGANGARLLMREAALRFAGVYLDGIEALSAAGEDAQGARALLQTLDAMSAPLFCAASPHIKPRLRLDLVRALNLVEVPLKPPKPEARERLWRARLEPRVASDHLALMTESARAFQFDLEAIEDVLRLAELRRSARGRRSSERLEPADLEAACVSMASQQIGQFARRVRSLSRWEDVVLTEETRQVVDEIMRFGKHAHEVFNRQGYGARMTYGKGLTALFYGPSGTGKTMVSSLLAREMGLELFQIDLSQIVSKYIGETEERLGEVFNEAESGGVALLFDEADSLFAGRTSVKSSVDRYANLEVNYLLQRIEQHEGVVFLTTNFPDSIDDAFMRRLRFKVEFPAPESEEREELWRKMIPEDAPVEPDLDLSFVASRYELTGGQIRNALLRAAFYAAGEQRPLALEHVERAAQVEYRESGRLIRAPAGTY